jgi:hypothetical protein
MFRLHGGVLQLRPPDRLGGGRLQGEDRGLYRGQPKETEDALPPIYYVNVSLFNVWEGGRRDNQYRNKLLKEPSEIPSWIMDNADSELCGGGGGSGKFHHPQVVVQHLAVILAGIRRFSTRPR